MGRQHQAVSAALNASMTAAASWLLHICTVVLLSTSPVTAQLEDDGIPCPLARGVSDPHQPMICDIHTPMPFSRQDVLDLIKWQKSRNPNYRVIDFGPSLMVWSMDLIDAYVDLIPSTNTSKSLEAYIGDLNERETFEPILETVKIRGKFDLAICSHTLEDLRDPVVLLKMLPSIAKAGYIATPSKQAELARFEFGSTGPRGWLHHRWIFIVDQDKHLLACPKLPVIDATPRLDEVAATNETYWDNLEMRLWWRNGLPFRLLNGDFMGPNYIQDAVNHLSVLLLDSDWGLGKKTRRSGAA